MKRLLAVLAVVAVLVGCKSGTSVTDPFFGRTTVTPPGTGQIPGQGVPGQGATNPYYAPPAGGGTSAQPQTPPQWLLGPQNAVPSTTTPKTSPSPPTATTAPGTFTPQWATPQTPSATAPSATTPGKAATPNRYLPPGGSYNYKGSSDSSRSTGSSWSQARAESPSLIRNSQGNMLTTAATDSRSGGRNEPIGKLATDPTIPAAATSSAVATAGSSGGQTGPSGVNSTVGGSLAGRERIIRTIEPRPMDAAARSLARPWPYGATSAGRSTGRSTTPSKAIDIMDLPPARSSASSAGLQSPRTSGGVRLASGSSGSFTPSARYGHDPEYRWLRGKLEYSQIDRGWKLRYIPIDGQTDDYGGSVVLGKDSLGAGLERGHFVEVRGQLAGGAKPEHGYAPVYEVAEIKRLDK